MAKIHEIDTVPAKTIGPQNTRRLDPVQVDPLLRAAAIEEQFAYRRSAARELVPQQDARHANTAVIDMRAYRRRAEIEELVRRSGVRKVRRVSWLKAKVEVVTFTLGQLWAWARGR